MKRIITTLCPLAFLIAISLLLPGTTAHAAEPAQQATSVTQNKQTVQTYMEGFRQSDHAAILACLMEDVEWVMPGAFHLKGKADFDKEIENPGFTGRPEIQIIRLIEESNVVVAEGRVRASRKEGGTLNAVFCDVFEMKDGKVRRLTSYLMESKEPRPGQ
ncbi:MAG: nuclear transport factor 2 family protein [Verrucomicrobiota bacterium]